MATAAVESHKPWPMRRVVAASSAGTAFEWYDFFIFGSLATTIQKVFFAGLDPTAGLIAALGLFAAGFAFRPLGRDHLRRHRRPARPQGRLPCHRQPDGRRDLRDRPAADLLASAGIISPILLILLRICQGIALGGEYGGAAIYVAEHAPNNRRGMMTGWIQITASLGLIAGLLVILGTRTAIGEDAFLDWGWRVPFLLSSILLSISVWMRFKLSESPAFAKLKEEGEVSQTPLREAFAQVGEPASAC